MTHVSVCRRQKATLFDVVTSECEAIQNLCYKVRLKI